MENPEKDIMVGLIDAEGSGGLTSEDYDVKVMAGPAIVARSIIFNVAEGLHVSFSFYLRSTPRCLGSQRFYENTELNELNPAHSAFWLSGWLCACLAAQEREILQKLAVMTEVAKKLVERQGTEKPFGFLNIVFQKCREEEMQEDRRAQLLNFEDDEMDEGAAERDKIRRELLACFEVSGTISYDTLPILKRCG